VPGNNTNSYDAVSLIYGKLMKGVNYKRWSKYLLDIIENHIIKDNPFVLELGAGNCRIGGIISQKFPSFIATDLSFPMLRQAKKVTVNKICCDMTALPVKEKFDLIFSTFDSVNYLLSNRRLLTLFLEVKKVLKNEGIFTFDVSLENNSLNFNDLYTMEGRNNGYHFSRKSKYYPVSRIHKNTFNIIDQYGEIKREVHKQKIYKFETYFDLIEKAGLYVVECLAAFTFNNGNSNSDRVQFILKNDINKC
jgi:SAM-dependent methyltransferase